MNKDNFRFRDWLLFAAYSIVAVRLSFLMAVGPKSLYPRNIAWLGQDDPATHYLGWLFFRNSECFIVKLREQYHKICLNPVGFRQRLELSDDLRSCAYGNYVSSSSRLKIKSPSSASCTVPAIFLKSLTRRNGV